MNCTTQWIPLASRRFMALGLSLSVALGMQPFNAFAAYPERAIKLIVPFPAGGATDIIGRVVAQKLTVALGQSVVVENRGGAAGNIGAAAAAKETPDGYTLLLGALTSHSINSVLMSSAAGFSIDKSFAPISIVGRVPLVVVVGPSVRASTLSELISVAKKKPGGLNYGSSGNGSPQHLAAELFKRLADVRIVHIPYKGSSPALTDLMAGQVDVIFDTLPAAQSFIKAGKLRALAIATEQRNPSIADVPTTAEAGLKGFEVSSMFGLLAPTATPPAVVNRLNAALKEIMTLPDVKESMAGQGVAAVFTSPEEAAIAIKDEVAKWTKTIKESGIKAD